MEPMTWVIATSLHFPIYGCLFSDVQVTLHDGTTRDVLRKAYPLDPNAAAGFAGSVQIGFALLESLRALLLSTDAAAVHDKGRGSWVAKHWPVIASRVFASSPAEERRLGAEVIAAFVADYTYIGKRSARPNFYAFKAKAPHFKPMIVTAPFKPLSIGSGADIPHFMRAIHGLTDWKSTAAQAEIRQRFGWASFAAFSLSVTSEDSPVHGVSEHFNALAFDTVGYREFNSSRRVHLPDREPVPKRMPPLASSFTEFANLIGSAADAAGARA